MRLKYWNLLIVTLKNLNQQNFLFVPFLVFLFFLLLKTPWGAHPHNAVMMKGKTIAEGGVVGYI